MWLTGGAVVLGMLMFCLAFPVLIFKLKNCVDQMTVLRFNRPATTSEVNPASCPECLHRPHSLSTDCNAAPTDVSIARGCTCWQQPHLFYLGHCLGGANASPLHNAGSHLHGRPRPLRHPCGRQPAAQGAVGADAARPAAGQAAHWVPALPGARDVGLPGLPHGPAFYAHP